MTAPPTGLTEVIPDLHRHPLTRRPRPDPLRLLLAADCFALFVGFATAAALTSHDWLRLPDTLIAVTALTGSLRYCTDRRF